MTPEEALAALADRADAAGAEDSGADAGRRHLGVPNGDLDLLVRDWRRALPLSDRLPLARALWDSDIHEGRVAAAKLLSQARIAGDAEVWALIASWVPQVDAPVIADHVAIAGAKRLVADPARLDEVETWAASDDLWTRRAALSFTLPWARLTHPKAADTARRERILGWAAAMAGDRRRPIQLALARWLRDLSKRTPEATRAFLEAHGATMDPAALREASRVL